MANYCIMLTLSILWPVSYGPYQAGPNASKFEKYEIEKMLHKNGIEHTHLYQPLPIILALEKTVITIIYWLKDVQRQDCQGKVSGTENEQVSWFTKQTTDILDAGSNYRYWRIEIHEWKWDKTKFTPQHDWRDFFECYSEWITHWGRSSRDEHCIVEPHMVNRACLSRGNCHRLKVHRRATCRTMNRTGAIVES